MASLQLDHTTDCGLGNNNLQRAVTKHCLPEICTGAVTVTPHTTWMKTTQQDLESLNLSLNEAIDAAQNHPLWRMMSTFGATHSVVHDRNE